MFIDSEKITYDAMILGESKLVAWINSDFRGICSIITEQGVSVEFYVRENQVISDIECIVTFKVSTKDAFEERLYALAECHYSAY